MSGVRQRSRIGRTIGCALAALAIVAVENSSASADALAGREPDNRLPATYVVSERPGVLPEGIGVGRHGTFYVTSSATGAVYRGNIRDRRMTPFIPAGADGRHSALGVHVDSAERIFVTGASALDVYSRNGTLLAHRPAPAGAIGPASLNDLVITRDAVYVTDFANPVVLRASLHHGRVGTLRPWVDVSDTEPNLPPQFWFLNGIDVSQDGRTLLVSSQGLEKLLRIRIEDRRHDEVDLGSVPFAADGLELNGTTLLAVLNVDAPTGQGVYVAKLEPDLATGRVVAAVSGPASPFDSPTTLARVGGRVLVVNSQLDHPPGTAPFTVSAVRIRGTSATPRPSG